MTSVDAVGSDQCDRLRNAAVALVIGHMLGLTTTARDRQLICTAASRISIDRLKLRLAAIRSMGSGYPGREVDEKEVARFRGCSMAPADSTSDSCQVMGSWEPP